MVAICGDSGRLSKFRLRLYTILHNLAHQIETGGQPIAYTRYKIRYKQDRQNPENHAALENTQSRDVGNSNTLRLKQVDYQKQSSGYQRSATSTHIRRTSWLCAKPEVVETEKRGLFPAVGHKIRPIKTMKNQDCNDKWRFFSVHSRQLRCNR